MKMFMVGGAVRDELLGVQSKDIDFTCVLEKADIDAYTAHNRLTPFEYMVFFLEGQGFKIFLETPDYLTVRAQFPKGHEHSGLTADFVLARKESNYTDGRRPDTVEPGSLLEDLRRRDFTMNAIAKKTWAGDDSDGAFYIDPFDGREDIKNKIIRCVGNPEDRFREDALRIVRAMRFAVTTGFGIEQLTRRAMTELAPTVADVSAERVREELTKMFNVNPRKTIVVLGVFKMYSIIFDMGINFQPTLRSKIK